MGLLDSLKNVDPATAQGLLQMGLSMLQSKGGLANALGAGGMAGIQGANQFKDRQAQMKQRGLLEQLTNQQIAQGQRQQEIQGLARQFSIPGKMPETMDARDIGQVGEPQIPTQGFDAPGFGQALMALDPVQGLQFQAATRKAEPTPLRLSKDEQLRDPKTFAVLASNLSQDDPNKGLPSGMRMGANGPEWIPGYLEGKKTVAKAGASNISLSADKGFAGAFGKNAADALQDAQDKAAAAQASNATIGSIRDAMKSGSVILGPGAQTRQTLLRAGQVIGAGSPTAAAQLEKTKQVQQGLAQIELSAAQLMKGQGQITEAERGIIRRAAAGEIQDLTPQELDVALKAIERNNKAAVESYKRRAKTVEGNPALGSLGGLISPPEEAQPDRVRRYNPATGKIE